MSGESTTRFCLVRGDEGRSIRSADARRVVPTRTGRERGVGAEGNGDQRSVPDRLVEGWRILVGECQVPLRVVGRNAVVEDGPVSVVTGTNRLNVVEGTREQGVFEVRVLGSVAEIRRSRLLSGNRPDAREHRARQARGANHGDILRVAGIPVAGVDQFGTGVWVGIERYVRLLASSVTQEILLPEGRWSYRAGSAAAAKIEAQVKRRSVTDQGNVGSPTRFPLVSAGGGERQAGAADRSCIGRSSRETDVGVRVVVAIRVEVPAVARGVVHRNAETCGNRVYGVLVVVVGVVEVINFRLGCAEAVRYRARG